MRCLALLVLPMACREGAEAQHDSLVKLCGREFIRTVVASCGGSWGKFYWRTGQEPGKASAKPLGWLNSDQFSAGPEAAEGPGSPEGTRHPPGEPRSCPPAPARHRPSCTRGCTRAEMMPFC